MAVSCADADRLVSAADLAQYGKLAVAVCKKYLNLAGKCWQNNASAHVWIAAWVHL